MGDLAGRMLGSLPLSVAVLSLLAVGCAAGPGSPALTDPLPVDGRVAGGAQIGDQIYVVVSPIDRPDPPAADILTLSTETGHLVSEARVSGLHPLDGVASFEDRLLVRSSTQLPGLLATAGEGLPSGLFPLERWLVVVDPVAMEPIEQYWLPEELDGVDPLLVVDGVVWLLGDGHARQAIDLRTGESLAFQTLDDGLIHDVRRIDDRLLVIRRDRILQYDLTTGETRLEHVFGNDPDVGYRPGSGFRYHEGRFWMSGFDRDDWDQVYRYDLATAEMAGDPRPAEELPTASLEMGAYRWELYRPGDVFPLPYSSSVDPEPGDVWRLVSRETGEVRDEFDLGDWSPRFATDGRLWLTRPQAGGSGGELASMEVP